MNALCPHCGYNLAADAPYDQGLWFIDPQAGYAMFADQTVAKRASWARVLHTLAAASPNIVSLDALLNRVSSSEDPVMIRTVISQIKHQWPAGAPWPVESVRGHGYRWVG